MKSYKYSIEGVIEEFEGDIGGKPYFRKYIDQTDKIERTIVHILKRNPHPNIVDIYDIGPGYIDMELLNTKKLEFKDVQLQQKDLIDAKKFMQSLGIVYLDWKLDNFGLSNENVVKVFDFDMSGMYLKNTFTDTTGLKGFLWRDAESAGMKMPVEIDDWIFNNFLMGAQ